MITVETTEIAVEVEVATAVVVVLPEDLLEGDLDKILYEKSQFMKKLIGSFFDYY